MDALSTIPENMRHVNGTALSEPQARALANRLKREETTRALAASKVVANMERQATNALLTGTSGDARKVKRAEIMARMSAGLPTDLSSVLSLAEADGALIGDGAKRSATLGFRDENGKAWIAEVSVSFKRSATLHAEIIVPKA